jgi:nucleotide-binding universal stress UspA family protein
MSRRWKRGREKAGTPLVEFLQKRAQGQRPDCLKRIKDIVVEEGNPVEVILKVAADKDCDVIIMGNHGAGGWTHTFLGNVAKKVLRRSKKPVYIIPLPE